MYCQYLANGSVDAIVGDCVQAKYLMVKLIQVFGAETPIPGTYKSLGRELGVSEHLVKEAMSLLAQQNLLEGKSEEGARISGRYRVNKLALLFGRQAHPAVEAGMHRRLIDHLLMRDTAVAYAKRRHKLKISGRLLLAVLLSRADWGGVVRDLGRSEICRLTGLNPDRLQSQLFQLLELGYVRSYYCGGTGSHFLVKAKNVYFLNLSHECYREAAYSRYIFLISMGDRSVENECNEAQQLFDAARKYALLPFKDENKSDVILIRRKADCTKQASLEFPVGLIAPFFMEPTFTGMEDYLQMKLLEYSSMLLSLRNYRSLTGVNAYEFEVMAKIKNDLQFARLTRKGAVNEFPSAEQMHALSMLIFQIVKSMADSIASYLNMYQLIKYRDMFVQILPVNQKMQSRGDFAVELFYKSAQGHDSDYIEIRPSDKDNVWVVNPNLTEERLSNADRYRFGLKTEVETKVFQL